MIIIWLVDDNLKIQWFNEYYVNFNCTTWRNICLNFISLHVISWLYIWNSPPSPDSGIFKNYFSHKITYPFSWPHNRITLFSNILHGKGFHFLQNYIKKQFAKWVECVYVQRKVISIKNFDKENIVVRIIPESCEQAFSQMRLLGQIVLNYAFNYTMN